MTNKGVTLIELMVVLAVAALLIIATAFNYQGWIGRYKAESAIKTLYSDLMDGRARAMQRGLTQFCDFQTTKSYRIIEDTNDNDALDASPPDTVLSTFPKTLEHPLTWAGGWIRFEREGTISTQLGGLMSSNAVPSDEAICMFTDFDGDKVSDLDADYDCIILSKTRILTGKLIKQDTDGGKCAPVLPTDDPNYDADNACRAK